VEVSPCGDGEGGVVVVVVVVVAAAAAAAVGDGRVAGMLISRRSCTVTL